MFVNRMPKREDVRNDCKEATVAAHHVGEGYKDISESIGVHLSAVVISSHKTKTFKKANNLCRRVGVTAGSVQGQTV